MKIQSSDVNIESKSSNSYDINLESKTSFQTTLLNTNSSNKKIDDTNTKALNKEEIKFYKIENYESDLTQIHKVSKIIVELILEGFLKVKGIKLYPYKNKNEAQPLEQKEAIKHVFKYERTFEYTKKDSIEISSKAIIKTNSKDIEIDLKLSYSKEFYEKHSENIQFENISFLDPLVINYDGNINALDNISEEMTFMFDLNSNGKKENIPLLKSGNGFLAIDKNNNGKIDDGSELFGPQTNFGFEELRAYDNDNNSWIDENDEVFKDLSIWSKSEGGEDKLIALGQSGIGALYLNDVSSELNYNNSVNNSLAQLKSSSIYIKNDGTAGLLSSLDFIVNK